MVKDFKIVIAEDEIIIAADLKLTLEQAGFNVIGITSSGEDTITKSITEKPDLVFMDIQLKGELNGIQTAERLISEHKIPIVFLTAYGDSDTLSAAKNLTPWGIILKPFAEDELLSLTKQICISTAYTSHCN